MKKRSQLVAFIDYKKDLQSLSDDNLVAIIGGSRSKYSKRKDAPEGFKLGELQRLARALKMDITISKDGSVRAE